jgi:hypothetical protein
MTMDHVRQQFWAVPDRLKPSRARLLIALSIPQLIIAGLGFISYEGWYLVAYVSAFTLIGLSNFAWGLGSILPEEQGGITLRGAMRPVSIVMFLSLITVIGFQLANLD